MDKERVIIKIEDKYYTVDSDMICEVIRKGKIFKVPNSPKYVSGVIYYEGEIVPVINYGSDDRNYLLIIYYNGEKIAVAGDDLLKESEYSVRIDKNINMQNIIEMLDELEDANG